MLHSVKTRLFAAALCGAMLLTTACGGRDRFCRCFRCGRCFGRVVRNRGNRRDGRSEVRRHADDLYVGRPEKL